MAVVNLLSRQCPVCHVAAIAKSAGSEGLGATHRCGNCGAQLKVAATPSVLWSIPVLALLLSGYYIILGWLRDNAMFTGVLRAVALGGLGGLCLSIVLRVAARGFVFKAVSAPSAKA